MNQDNWFRGNFLRYSELVRDELTRFLGLRGSHLSAGHPQFVELRNTVLGDPALIQMIQGQPFAEGAFREAINEAIQKWYVELLPDTCKRQFCSIDQLDWALASEEETSHFCLAEEPDTHIPSNTQPLPDSLSDVARNYLKKLAARYPAVIQNQQWEQFRQENGFTDKLQKKLSLLARFYPDGEIEWFAQRDGRENFTRDDLKRIYLNRFVGLETAYPKYFLERDAEFRSAVIVNFLVSDILQTDVRDVLPIAAEDFFRVHHLQNVYRLFNYSANRVFANAFPDMVSPWENSRSDANYWDHPDNRVEAVRWLVEKRLGRRETTFYRNPVRREDFTANGLSFLFNQHYNSVRKALAEAYPSLPPYQIGSVPFSFWNEHTAAEAIRWMVAELGWEVDALPEKVRSKALNRKTFSTFGLATLFERRFSKNIFKAVDAAWPGKFHPWEFGKIASSYWDRPDHVFQASAWIAKQEGIHPSKIPTEVRKGKMNLNLLQKYSIGRALRKWCAGKIETIFAPWFWKEHREFLKEHMLRRKIKHLQRKASKHHPLEILLYGWFYSDVQISSRNSLNQYHRIERRIRMRSILDPDN